MNGFEFMNSAAHFIEISQSSLRVVHGMAGLELPLERLPNGKLTPACKAQLISSLKAFLKRPAWRPRLRAWCAIGARGVLLRRLSLPPAAKSEIKQLLRLQIESEFPLSPDELAWGFLRLKNRVESRVQGPESPECKVPSPESRTRERTLVLTRDSGPGTQDFLVAAIRKEVIVEYSELLADCGVSPIFTLAAVARSHICPRPPGAYAVLEIGRDHSELLSFDQGAPVALRVLPWGAENFTAMDSLAAALKSNGSAQKLYVTGNSAQQKEVAAQLAKSFGEGLECEPVEFTPGSGQSAAIRGLKSSAEKEAGRRLLVLEITETKKGMALGEPVLRKWAALAGLLLLGCLLFPYAEAVLLKAHLSKKLAVAKASRGTMATIDRELSFLQYLKKNQSPYLDAIYLMANATPGGTRLDSLSMDRRGEISMRGNLRNLEQVVQFRSKLIESGFFSNVTVEEQTPTPDRQKVIVRLTAQWKPASARESLKIGPNAEEMEKIKIAAKDAAPGGMPMMGAPFPMMPGMRGMPSPMPMPEMGGPPPGSGPGRMPPRGVMIRTNDGASTSGVPVIAPPTMEKKE